MRTLRLIPDVYDKFVDHNLHVYEALFEHFGHEWPANDNLVALANRTRKLWVPQGADGVKGEFGDPIPAAYDDDKVLAAAPILEPAGLMEAIAPPDDGKPKIPYAAGRKYAGIEAAWAGFDLIMDSGPVPYGIAAFGSRGRRPFDGTLEELYQRGENAGVAHLPWVREQFVSSNPLGNEGTLGIYSALCYFGPDRVVLPRKMPEFDGGAMELVIVEIDGVQFYVTGAQKVDRSGPRRPTAHSAAVDAMDIVPVAAGRTLAIIGGAIHGPRIAADVARGIGEVYDDLEFWAVARSAADMATEDPHRAVRLQLHELALWAGNTTPAKTVRG